MFSVRFQAGAQGTAKQPGLRNRSGKPFRFQVSDGGSCTAKDEQGALANLTGKVGRGPVATQVVRDYGYTLSADKLPVCLPVLG